MHVKGQIATSLAKMIASDSNNQAEVDKLRDTIMDATDKESFLLSKEGALMGVTSAGLATLKGVLNKEQFEKLQQILAPEQDSNESNAGTFLLAGGATAAGLYGINKASKPFTPNDVMTKKDILKDGGHFENGVLYDKNNNEVELDEKDRVLNKNGTVRRKATKSGIVTKGVSNAVDGVSDVLQKGVEKLRGKSSVDTSNSTENHSTNHQNNKSSQTVNDKSRNHNELPKSDINNYTENLDKSQEKTPKNRDFTLSKENELDLKSNKEAEKRWLEKQMQRFEPDSADYKRYEQIKDRLDRGKYTTLDDLDDISKSKIGYDEGTRNRIDKIADFIKANKQVGLDTGNNAGKALDEMEHKDIDKTVSGKATKGQGFTSKLKPSAGALALFAGEQLLSMSDNEYAKTASNVLSKADTLNYAATAAAFGSFIPGGAVLGGVGGAIVGFAKDVMDGDVSRAFNSLFGMNQSQPMTIPIDDKATQPAQITIQAAQSTLPQVFAQNYQANTQAIGQVASGQRQTAFIRTATSDNVALSARTGYANISASGTDLQTNIKAADFNKAMQDSQIADQLAKSLSTSAIGENMGTVKWHDVNN
ncbi:MAG TPA: hypothetical protein EYP79_03850, partial [Campylobacterales bacterium]|nr:hypothetical protein [Campylobacterales bacterium]